MKEITIYECEDGTRFDKREYALEYECYYKIAKGIESRLISIGRRLARNEYIQQDKEVVRAAKYDFITLLIEVARPNFTERLIKCRNGEVPFNCITSVIADNPGSNQWIYHLYMRFSSIDKDGREYQQPYFTTHPEEATKKVN